MPTKELLIVAGPNGSGKSTYIGQLLAMRAMPYYSADLIATEFAHLYPVVQQLAAGREFILRIDRQLGRDEDFVLETTMSGRTLQHFVRRAQSAGYHVSIYFIYVDSAQTSLARVRERVRNGGHDVPEDDVFRRFSRCFTNFWRIYRKIADSWFIAYNFTGDFVRVASGEQDAIVVHDGNEFKRFLRLAGESVDVKDER